MNKKTLTLIEIVIASMILVTIIIYSLLAFNNVLFLSEHSSNFSLAMEGAKAMLEEIKSKSLETIKSDYSGYTFDILDKSGNFLGKGRVDAEDLSGNWTKVIDNALWAKRMCSGVVFDNKIWVMGGYDGSNYLNDVWYSSDGVNWVKALDNDPLDTNRWSPRINPGVVVFDNKIWVMGGYDGSNYLNDVWYSSDGVNWVKALDNDPLDTNRWSPRINPGVVVFDNKIWVMGGYDGSNYLNDVWYSSDGVNWVKALDNDPLDTNRWSPRINPGVVVFDNKIWVMGGYDGSNYLNDVWYSSDGVNWVKALDNDPLDTNRWSPRINPGVVVFDNKIWVMGGYDGSNYLNDVWYSSDGVNWVKALDNDPLDTNRWSPRINPGVVVFDNKIWVMGGYDGSNYLNDVWYTCGYNRLLKIKITCCWKERGGRIIGEDKNLNGQLDSGEDINGNGELDSPIKLVTYIANKEFPQRVFFIEE